MSKWNYEYLLFDTVNDTIFLFFLNCKCLFFLPTNHRKQIPIGLDSRDAGEEGYGIVTDFAFLLRYNRQLLFIQICLAYLSTGESDKFDKKLTER